MPFVPHRRVTFRGVFGTLAAPYEQWSFRLNTSDAGDPGQDLAAIAAGAAGIFQQDVAQLGGLRTVIREYCRLTEVKVADIGADGKYVREPGIALVDIAGSSTAGSVHAPQVAVAVSLVTDRRGASGRGRFYIPAPAVDVEPLSGRMSIAAAQNIAAVAGRFVDDISRLPGLGVVAVQSNKGLTSGVEGVRVGRVLDTIRSRRTSIAEDYGATVVTTQ